MVYFKYTSLLLVYFLKGDDLCMIKPKRLKVGDTVALVSLSSGLIGESAFIHKYTLAQKRLKELFGLNLIAMPNSLKGIEYLYNHPEKRAEDFMNAFKDENIKGIICAIGGEDTIRLLPYIDFEVIKNNPKIFLGYSDTTINHFMMYKAGITSFYGPNIMCDFAEYGNMYEYTENAIKELLFLANPKYEMKKSPYWVNDFIEWDEKNIDKVKERIIDTTDYEILQGNGKVNRKIIRWVH